MPHTPFGEASSRTQTFGSLPLIAEPERTARLVHRVAEPRRGAGDRAQNFVLVDRLGFGPPDPAAEGEDIGQSHGDAEGRRDARQRMELAASVGSGRAAPSAVVVIARVALIVDLDTKTSVRDRRPKSSCPLLHRSAWACAIPFRRS